jgi:hypothetical protein
MIARNQDLFGSALGVARQIDEVAGLASSILQRMEALRLTAELAQIGPSRSRNDTPSN